MQESLLVKPSGKNQAAGSELDRFPHSSRGSALNTKALLEKTRTCAIMKKDL